MSEHNIKFFPSLKIPDKAARLIFRCFDTNQSLIEHKSLSYPKKIIEKHIQDGDFRIIAEGMTKLFNDLQKGNYKNVSIQAVWK
jgi:predicted DNA-binding protein